MAKSINIPQIVEEKLERRDIDMLTGLVKHHKSRVTYYRRQAKVVESAKRRDKHARKADQHKRWAAYLEGLLHAHTAMDKFDPHKDSDEV